MPSMSAPSAGDADLVPPAGTAQALRRLDRAAALRDGTPVRMRLIRESDREELVEAFSHLDPDAIYTRFHGMKKTLTEADLERLTKPDLERSVVLVMTLDGAEPRQAFAAASCNLLGEPGVADTAEVSFTVEEAFRGRGAGSLLLAQFIDIARARGLKRLIAEVLTLNAPMLAVFKACGLPVAMKRENTVIHVTMSLEGTT